VRGVCFFVVTILALIGCAGDDDVADVAREDLRCDSVTVFKIDGPTEVTRPFLERRRNECSVYTSTRYRVEGCSMARVYECQECRAEIGPNICDSAGPILVE
jgi:hypothetical protein